MIDAFWTRANLPSYFRDGPLESDGGGQNQNENLSQDKKLGNKIFPGIVKNQIPSLEDRPIKFT